MNRAPQETLLEQHALVLEVTPTKRQLPNNATKRLRRSGLEMGSATSSHAVVTLGKAFYLLLDSVSFLQNGYNNCLT